MQTKMSTTLGTGRESSEMKLVGKHRLRMSRLSAVGRRRLMARRFRILCGNTALRSPVNAAATSVSQSLTDIRV